MAIIDAETYAEWRNVTLEGGELDSVTLICAQVDRAIKNKLKRTLEQQTFTGLILSAPTTPCFALTRYAPITISTTRLWLNTRANGDPSAFDDDNELVLYDDFTLDSYPEDATLSPGNVQRVNQVTWAVQYRPRFTQIRYQEVPAPGAIKATFEGGYETIPVDIVEAACLAVSQILTRRKYGYMVGAENWNRYGYSLAGMAYKGSDVLINGVLGSPDIENLLSPYMNYEAVIG